MSSASPMATARSAHPATRVGQRWLSWAARAGLVSRGVVYGVVGILALQLAIGAGGATPSQRGALERIAREPLGGVALIVLAAGLGGYATWRLVSAVTARRESGDHGRLDRVAAAASGLAYAALCATALKILAGARTTGGVNNPKRAAAGVLGWPAGPELVATAGVVLIGVAGFQGYAGFARKFLERLRTGEMSRRVRATVTALGVFGYLARMVIFALIGFGLIKAALDYKPRDAIGLDGALQKLARSSAGPLLLGIVAAGVIGFALYSVAEARYRRV
jgi:Domain of Unknown Function (DUF1206)